MHAHNQVRVVIGDDDSNPLAFDLSKTTPLRIALSLFSQRIGDYEFGISATQLVELQPIPGMFGEPHTRLRA
jgi:hypothetical protein